MDEPYTPRGRGENPLITQGEDEHHPNPFTSTNPSNIPQARITVIEMIRHQIHDGVSQADSLDNGYTQFLVTDEQVFNRHFKVEEGREWKSLETGWIKDCSLLVLKNKEGERYPKIPTQQEKDNTMLRIIELGNNDLIVLVRPCQSIRLEPKDLSQWKIRCQHKTARCAISLYPR
jgi:hypothetical protein